MSGLLSFRKSKCEVFQAPMSTLTWGTVASKLQHLQERGLVKGKKGQARMKCQLAGYTFSKQLFIEVKFMCKHSQHIGFLIYYKAINLVSDVVIPRYLKRYFRILSDMGQINDAFDIGDTYTFDLSHLKGSDDANVNKLVTLIEEIQDTIDNLIEENEIEEDEIQLEDNQSEHFTSCKGPGEENDEPVPGKKTVYEIDPEDDQNNPPISLTGL